MSICGGFGGVRHEVWLDPSSRAVFKYGKPVWTGKTIEYFGFDTNQSLIKIFPE